MDFSQRRWLSLRGGCSTEWVRRAWNLNDSAPAEPEVTLAFDGDRIEGAAPA